MQNKRGLSEVITSVIMVLLVLITVVIVWVVVKNILSSGTDEISISKITIKLAIKNVVVDNVSNNVSITLKREVGEGDVSGIKFVVTDGISSQIFQDDSTLRELEEKKFTFTINETIQVENVTEVSVVPILTSSSGKALSGMTYNYDVQEGTTTTERTTKCASTIEICNNLDDDCDGQIDEEVKIVYYTDSDNDNFGNLTNTSQACSKPIGYINNSQDCNDNNTNVNPGASEVCDNFIDDDCDGQADENCDCVPATNCSSVNYECGSFTDDCSNILDCGDCSILYNTKFSCNSTHKCVCTLSPDNICLDFPSDYYSYEDVLLVINQNSSISKQIGEYYLSQRPSLIYVVYINTSQDENISFYEFNRTVRKQIENYIVANNIQNKTNYIITTKGVPLKTFSGLSVDSLLTLILGNYSWKINDDAEIYSWLTNPYYLKEEPFSHSKYNIYLVTRLTGYTFDDVKRLIDGSANADNNGIVLFEIHPSKDNPTYKEFNDNMRQANTTLVNRGYLTNPHESSTAVSGANNLLGYVGWGSNGGNNQNASKWNLSFNPGSIAETYVSTSARTFEPTIYTANSQSLIADLITANVTGVKGYVSEPYMWAMAKPNILFDRYTKGYNLADSFYMASNFVKWKDVVVGDPKTVIIK